MNAVGKSLANGAFMGDLRGVKAASRREQPGVNPAAHSTWKAFKRACEKVLCFVQKKYKDQTEFSGLTSWIKGAMANACIS